MKNKDVVSRALEILRDTMAPWLCMQLKTKINGYEVDDTLWWEEGVRQTKKLGKALEKALRQFGTFNDCPKVEYKQKEGVME